MHGWTFDCMGDVAINDGHEGHQTWHFLPDSTLTSRSTSAHAVDLKVFDLIGSSPADAERHGAHVAFGKTLPRTPAGLCAVS